MKNEDSNSRLARFAKNRSEDLPKKKDESNKKKPIRTEPDNNFLTKMYKRYVR